MDSNRKFEIPTWSISCLINSFRKVLGTIVSSTTYGSWRTTVYVQCGMRYFILRFRVHFMVLWKFRHQSTSVHSVNVHRFVEMSITVLIHICIGNNAISSTSCQKTVKYGLQNNYLLNLPIGRQFNEKVPSSIMIFDLRFSDKSLSTFVRYIYLQ